MTTTTTRSNRKTPFIFTTTDGRKHADKLHGNGMGAHVKLFRRMCDALFPGHNGMAIRNIEDNGRMVQIWTVQDFGTGETFEVAVEQFDGVL